MLLPEVEPNDFVNKHLRGAALAAQEQGQKVAAWHGSDAFTGEDVEVYLNLSTKIGGMALGRACWAAQVSEKGPLIVLHFKNESKGLVDIDIHAETLAMNRERTGAEAYNDGRVAHVRLYDKLSGEDILKLDGDEVHKLVEDKTLDPKDYHGSAFKYAKSMGLI